MCCGWRLHPSEKANSVDIVPGGVALNTSKLKMKKSPALRGQGVAKPLSPHPVRHVPRQASQISGTYLPDDFSCDAWRGTCLTGRGDSVCCIAELHSLSVMNYTERNTRDSPSIDDLFLISLGPDAKHTLGISYFCKRRLDLVFSFVRWGAWSRFAVKNRRNAEALMQSAASWPATCSSPRHPQPT